MIAGQWLPMNSIYSEHEDRRKINSQTHAIYFTVLKPLMQNGALQELIDVVSNHNPTNEGAEPSAF